MANNITIRDSSGALKTRKSTETNSVHVSHVNIDEAGTKVDAATMPAGGVGLIGWLSAIWSKLNSALTVSGSVSVSNLPATQAVSGSVSVSNLPATQTVSGSVSVANFPATQAVSGTVSVTNVATAANQTTANASLSTIATNTAKAISGDAIPATPTGMPLVYSDGTNWQIVDGTHRLPVGGAMSLQNAQFVSLGDGGNAKSSLCVGVIDIAGTAVDFGELVHLPGIKDAANNIDADIGAKADAAATTDTGTFSLLSLVKRGLQNWTTLLSRVPALVSGRIPVDVTFPGTQAVSIASLPALATGSSVIGAVTQSSTWSVRTQDGSGNALTSSLLGSSRASHVAIVDGSGNQITSFGGGTQYADGSSAATPTGTMTLWNEGGTVRAVSSSKPLPVSGTFWQATQPVSIASAVPVTDNSSSLTVDGKAYRVQVDLTRSSSTSPAYSALDVIGTGTGDDAVLTLANIGPSGGFVIAQSIELVLGIASVPSGMTSFRLHFYSSKPTVIADNAAFDLPSGDRANYIGYVDLPPPVDLGATCFTQVDLPGKLLKLASSSTSLFAILQTIGGYTPVGSEVYSLRIKTLEAGL